MVKHIICPRCGRRLMDTEETAQTEAKILAPEIEWQPDLYIKCWKCSSKVGIKVINRK
jgi:DNA-directed RNA polymerase subunit RPC12/RpoP